MNNTKFTSDSSSNSRFEINNEFTLSFFDFFQKSKVPIHFLESNTENVPVYKWIDKASLIPPTVSNLNFFSEKQINNSFEYMTLSDISLKTPNREEIILKTKPVDVKQATIESQEYYKKVVLKIIKNDRYESGYISDIETYIKDESKIKNLEIIKKAVLELFQKYYASDKHVIEGILNLLGGRSYKEMSPEGPLICLSLLQHKNIYIRDMAIQTFKKWNSKQALNYLKGLHCDQVWLQDYVNKVIVYLNKYGCD